MAKAYFELRENLYNISKLLIKKNFTTDNFIIENILNESIERYCSSLDNSILKILKKLLKNIHIINFQIDIIHSLFLEDILLYFQIVKLRKIIKLKN